MLLEAWGATVEGFDEVAALLPRLAQAERVAPDLLIVDYRLPQGYTGVDALMALRALARSGPAGHEDEAAKHVFYLPIKPVPPNKLRAMVAVTLGMR